MHSEVLMAVALLKKYASDYRKQIDGNPHVIIMSSAFILMFLLPAILPSHDCAEKLLVY